MKFNLSFFLLLAFAGSTFGQNTNINPELRQAQQRSFILDILDKEQSYIQEKPTGIRQRVIAQTAKGATFSDSAVFNYSGTRGSRFNYNDLGYNTILNPLYEPNILYPRSPNGMYMLADTISYYRSDTLSYKDYALYRPDNKCSLLITEFGPDYPFNRNKYVYTYNSNGFTESTYYSEYNDPGPFDTSGIKRYAYVGGKLLTDSSWYKENGIWSLASIHKYFYNTSGKIVVDSTSYASGTGLELADVSNFTYYPDNKLRTLTSTSFSGNSITEIVKDSFGYTNGINYVTYWQTQRDNFSWNTSRLRKEIKYPGTNGLPDSTTVHINADGSESGILYRYQYNNFDNPDEITSFEDGQSSGIPDQTYHFYYETFEDGLAVDQLKNDNDFSVYPNPFGNQINMECKSLLNENYTFRLLNTIGCDVFSVRSAFRNGKATVSVPQLPCGFYTLLVQSSDGRLVNKKVIKR
jgi:hypothetical protein